MTSCSLTGLDAARGVWAASSAWGLTLSFEEPWEG